MAEPAITVDDLHKSYGDFEAVRGISFDVAGGEMFIPTDQLPDSLVQIGRVFPLAHLAEGLQAGFGTGDAHVSGTNVAVLAARTFQWQPRARG